jgi:hypothetical protein
VIVYAETNLILELTLGREQCDSCRQLLEWAKKQQIALRLPAYAFYEARQALRRKQQMRRTLTNDLAAEVTELGRMRPFANVVDPLVSAGAVLTNVTATESALLDDVAGELDACTSDIPFDRRASWDLEIFRMVRLLKGDGDLIILSCVMSDLEKRANSGDDARSIFVTRNSRDFRDELRPYLRARSCDLLTSYDAAVSRLRTLLP